MKRRNLLKNSIIAATSLLSVAALAQNTPLCALSKTPQQPEGPFYPVVDQVDTDSDLIQLQGHNQIAKGKIIIVEGHLTDQKCKPVPNALVEIWQACETGKYNHPSDPNTAELDPNFQYWGKAITDQNGFYRFRTIIPGAYPADTDWIRPPHIHFKVAKVGYVELITQMYFAGEKYNRSDKILSRLSQNQQKEVIVNLVENAQLKHPVAIFNIKIESLLS